MRHMPLCISDRLSTIFIASAGWRHELRSDTPGRLSWNVCRGATDSSDSVEIIEVGYTLDINDRLDETPQTIVSSKKPVSYQWFMSNNCRNRDVSVDISRIQVSFWTPLWRTLTVYGQRGRTHYPIFRWLLYVHFFVFVRVRVCGVTHL